ncbi:cytochrome oxidase Cu insertion factor (SCO1/SenC/PrrC family) [Haloferula luteola]|uniref:Cytochrome oxidase Cu insertion factor (SCO1/SenC/PrrC family) n=1 Tax=Haloferula luteola TaxID=595692 RepID=A0A840V2X3_9BACT|nr:SCO family protein [Haloferula luteola]MBB5352345.1 cytochrome oxidase Cu insertion factor (SCO1/SenC/PrrC family) [Haloferula luteola]
MNRPADHLEPAERDPKKLRRTGLTLAALMLVSSLMVLIAYNRHAAEVAADDRPALIARLDKNFKVWRQDESEAGLLDLAGDVFVISPVAFSQPEGWSHTRPVLEKLVQRYGDREDFHIVNLTVDPENEPPAKLREFAAELGAELPQWWLAGAQKESVHKFLKNRLKAGFYPVEKDGVWHYDPSIVVVGRDRHIRKATVRARKPSGKELNYRNPVDFDFEQAAKWDAEGRSEGLESSNVEQLENLLYETIDHLLADPTIEDES